MTFVGNPKGRLISSVSPDPSNVSAVQHHSFIKLPEIAFTPRKFDPRSGAIPFSYYDYSTPVETATRKVHN